MCVYGSKRRRTSKNERKVMWVYLQCIDLEYILSITELITRYACLLLLDTLINKKFVTRKSYPLEHTLVRAGSNLEWNRSDYYPPISAKPYLDSSDCRFVVIALYAFIDNSFLPIECIVQYCIANTDSNLRIIHLDRLKRS